MPYKPAAARERDADLIQTICMFVRCVVVCEMKNKCVGFRLASQLNAIRRSPFSEREEGADDSANPTARATREERERGVTGGKIRWNNCVLRLRNAFLFV